MNGSRGNNSKCGEIFCKIPRSSLNSYPIGLKIGASEARLNSEWNTSLVERNPPGFDLPRKHCLLGVWQKIRLEMKVDRILLFLSPPNVVWMFYIAEEGKCHL